MKLKPKKIFVRCPNWVGDVVMATPVFECLRRNFPYATITGAVRSYARGVVEDGPWFDRIIEFDDMTLLGFYKLFYKIRAIQPDMTIVLPNSIKSALSVRLACAGKIYGYRRDFRSLLLNGGPVPLQDVNGFLPVPMALYYMEICKYLNLKIPEKIKPILYTSLKLKQKGNQFLKKYGIYPEDMVIGINPGAKFGSSKCWPAKYFANLAELFNNNYKSKILLFAGPGENKIAEHIIKQSKAPIINTGPDNINLSILKELVKRCQLLVTNDTGPRHYAVAFDVPVVVIIGPTDHRYTAHNLEKTCVLRSNISCSPCHKKTCPNKHECMRNITPESAFEAGSNLLASFKKKQI